MTLDHLLIVNSHARTDSILDHLLSDKKLAKPARNYLISCKVEGKSPRTIDTYSMVLTRVFWDGANPIIVLEPAGLPWLMVAVYLRSRHPDCRLVKAKTQKVVALRRYLRGPVKSERIDALTLAKMPFIDPEQMDEIYLPPAEIHALQRLTRQWEADRPGYHRLQPMFYANIER